MKTAGHNPALDGLPAILLRDLCECAECRDVSSGQRLGSVTYLPADVSVASTTVAGGAVEVVFGPDRHRDGFFLLRDVPCQPGTVLTVAGSMGYVRETNYGRLFDVRVEATPANLAFTGLPIAPHTDNPYRDPVPTVQLLHCLASAHAMNLVPEVRR